MAIETQELKLKITTDTTGAKQAASEVTRSFTELNQALEITSKLGSLVGRAIAGIPKLVDIGQGATELSAAFANLGRTSADLDKLRISTQGLITDTDLMRASNQALLSGLSPEAFDKLAESADALGDAVGVGTKQALDDLTLALATGQERLLKQYGITIDNAKAERDYALSIGRTADVLNETGKKEAARIAIMAKLEEQTAKISASTETLGDAFDKATTRAKNLFTDMAQFVNESPKIAGAINAVTDSIGGVFERSKQQLSDLNAAINKTGKDAIDAAIRLKEQGLAAIQNPGPIEKLIIRAVPGEDFEQTQIRKIREVTAELVKLRQESAKLGGQEFIGPKPQKAMEDLTGKVIDTEKALNKAKQASKDFADATKEAAEASLKSFKTFGDQLIKDFADIPIFGERAFLDLTATMGDAIQKELDESFKESVDFFSDLLTPMFEGQAANFEDIFLDAAKRVAIGFASQMLASFAESSGLIKGLQGITTAGGFGQALASTFGFEGGGTKGLGGLIGSVGGLFGGLFGGGAVPAVPEVISATSIATGAAGAGAATTGAGATAGLSSFLGPAALVAGGAFLLNSTGIFDGIFGGDSKKAKEREAREKLLDDIFKGNANLQTTKGSVDLSAGNFNASGKFLGQGTALVNPFAQILSGGDDKLGSDLAGIFENATTNADNFNEVLVNTQSLMAKLGISAEEAKNQVGQLFLEGKISLDEFGTDLQNLNVLAQNNLIGKGSVADALKIVADNAENPAIAIRGVALAFTEMAELGLTSSKQIHDYLTANFAPNVVAAFDKITAQGIDTFDEAIGGSADQIFLIADAVSSFQTAAAAASNEAASFGKAVDTKITPAIKNASNQLASLRDNLKGLNAPGNNKNQDRNTPNNLL